MYNSQFKQDEFLHKTYFNNKRNGVFVDVGAHDGITGNNSLFFEKHMGWSGICCEPLPKIYKQLSKNRNSVNIKCAIDEKDGDSKFYDDVTRREFSSIDILDFMDGSKEVYVYMLYGIGSRSRRDEIKFRIEKAALT